MQKHEQLFELAQKLVDERESFLARKMPGAGNLDTNSFMNELRSRAKATFGVDYAEAKLCEGTKFAVDYYFPEEATVVEIALSLRNSGNEFERDLFKVILAQEAGNSVKKLVFISKPGAKDRCGMGSTKAIKNWFERARATQIEIREFVGNSEAVLIEVTEDER